MFASAAAVVVAPKLEKLPEAKAVEKAPLSARGKLTPRASSRATPRSNVSSLNSSRRSKKEEKKQDEKKQTVSPLNSKREETKQAEAPLAAPAAAPPAAKTKEAEEVQELKELFSSSVELRTPRGGPAGGAEPIS